MKLFIRFFRWLVFLAFIAGGTYGIYYYMQPKPVAVDVAAVTSGPLVVTVDEDGKTRIKEKYVVSAPLSGRLARVTLEPGDFVLENSTLLAAIAPRRPELLDNREKLQAEMLVKAREAAMERADPLAERAKAAYEYAKKNHGRILALEPSRAASKDDLDRAAAELDKCEHDVRAAIYARRIAKYELDVARAALLRTQSYEEGDYSEFEIYSPITGRVLRILQKSATVVTSGTRLIEVGDQHDLEVVVDVLSTDAVVIETGADVILRRWGGEHPLHGKVRLVEPAAFTKLSALGVEEQRVNVIIDLVEPVKDRQSLGDGYRVEANIVTWETSETTKVPTAALFRERGDWAVFVVENGNTAQLRRISIGNQNDFEAEVLDGLEPSESVILHPSDRISDGITVSIRQGSDEVPPQAEIPAEAG